MASGGSCHCLSNKIRELVRFYESKDNGSCACRLFNLSNNVQGQPCCKSRYCTLRTSSTTSPQRLNSPVGISSAKGYRPTSTRSFSPGLINTLSTKPCSYTTCPILGAGKAPAQKPIANWSDANGSNVPSAQNPTTDKCCCIQSSEFECSCCCKNKDISLDQNDNVIQQDDLTTQRVHKLGVDPNTHTENAKKNFSSQSKNEHDSKDDKITEELINEDDTDIGSRKTSTESVKEETFKEFKIQNQKVTPLNQANIQGNETDEEIVEEFKIQEQKVSPQIETNIQGNETDDKIVEEFKIEELKVSPQNKSYIQGNKTDEEILEEFKIEEQIVHPLNSENIQENESDEEKNTIIISKESKNEESEKNPGKKSKSKKSKEKIYVFKRLFKGRESSICYRNKKSK